MTVWRPSLFATFIVVPVLAVYGLVALYGHLAADEREYFYLLRDDYSGASGQMRWSVRNRDSDARVALTLSNGTRETWDYVLEHDRSGRVIGWDMHQGQWIARWRYVDGHCTLTTPEGEHVERDCEPLRHPLLQRTECFASLCDERLPDRGFTALQSTRWHAANPVPLWRPVEGGAAELRSLQSSDGEVWWYAPSDAVPIHMSLPGGLVWSRVGEAPLPAVLLQARPLSVTGPEPSSSTSATFELRGEGTESLDAMGLSGGRQMGFKTREGVVRVEIAAEPAAAPPGSGSGEASATALFVMRAVQSEIEPRRTAARAPASVVEERGYGDCTDMAVLAAARLEAAGVNARVVAGLAHMGVWGLHAWVEFEDEGPGGITWRSADPSTGEVPAPTDRIRLATSLEAMERLSGPLEITAQR